MARKFQHKRGPKSRLTTLSPAEMAFTDDEKKLYFGDGNENIRLLDQKDKGEITAALAEMPRKVNGKSPDTNGNIQIDIPKVDTSNLATKQELQNIGNASPKGTYATLTALQAAFPTGTTGIYVVSADGKWYYWNGTAWTSGGQYQSTGIAEEAVTGKNVKKLTFQRYKDKGNVFKETLNPSSTSIIRNSLNNTKGDQVEIVEAYKDFKEYLAKKVIRLNFNNRAAGNAFEFDFNGINRIPITELGLATGDTFSFGVAIKLATPGVDRPFRIATTQIDSGTEYISGSAIYSTNSSGSSVVTLKAKATVQPNTAFIRLFIQNNQAVADGENLKVDIANWYIIKGEADTDIYVHDSELIKDEDLVKKIEYIQTVDDLQRQLANGETLATTGLNALLFGDSITTNQTIGTDGELTQTAGQTNWITYSKSYLKLNNVYNYAVSGAAFRQRTGVTKYQYLKEQIELAIAKAKPIDFIVVAAGTNDWEEFNDEAEFNTAMAITDMSTVDMTKIYQAVRWSFWRIRQAYPDKICFYGVPIQRAKGHESKKAFIENLKAIARQYNFIIIDAWAESGIISDFEVWEQTGRYLKDGLHPNEAGKKMMSKLYNRVILNTLKHQNVTL